MVSACQLEDVRNWGTCTRARARTACRYHFREIHSATTAKTPTRGKVIPESPGARRTIPVTRA